MCTAGILRPVFICFTKIPHFATIALGCSNPKPTGGVAMDGGEYHSSKLSGFRISRVFRKSRSLFRRQPARLEYILLPAVAPGADGVGLLHLSVVVECNGGRIRLGRYGEFASHIWEVRDQGGNWPKLPAIFVRLYQAARRNCREEA